MIREFVGLIGAGKTTYLETHPNDPHTHLLLEGDDMLQSFVDPLLTSVYNTHPGVEGDSEYVIEATFATIRSLPIRAFIAQDQRLALHLQPKTSNEAFSNLESFVKQHPDETLVINSLLMLLQRYDVPVNNTTAINFLNYAYMIKGISMSGDIDDLIVDRGLFDVLCFIAERLECIDQRHPTWIKLFNLFFSVLGYLIDEVYENLPVLFLERLRVVLSIFAKERFPYRIYYIRVEKNVANDRAIQRNRPSKVEDGRLKDRVIETNDRMHTIYEDVFANMSNSSTIDKAGIPLNRVIDRLLLRMMKTLKLQSLEKLVKLCSLNESQLCLWGKNGEDCVMYTGSVMSHMGNITLAPEILGQSILGVLKIYMDFRNISTLPSGEENTDKQPLVKKCVEMQETIMRTKFGFVGDMPAQEMYMLLLLCGFIDSENGIL